MTYGKVKFPRTILDGRLQFLSVTSVEKFDTSVSPYACERAWGYSYIDGIKEERTEAKDIGVQTHDQIDHFLNTGEDALGPVARAGRHLVYEPGPGLLVEHESLGELVLAGVPFYVRLDLANSRDYWLDNDGERRPMEDCVEVNDWKTTGDVVKNAKTAAELLNRTVQMPVYGAWAMGKFGTGSVRLSHTYFGTRRREALKSSLLVSRAQVEDRVAQVERVVERMKSAAGALRAVDLEPNYSACHASYRGCAYLGICPKSTQAADAYVRSLLSEEDGEMSSDLEKLLGMSLTATAAKPAPVPTVGMVVPAPAAVPAEAKTYTKEELEEAIARLQGTTAPMAGTPTLVGQAAKVAVPDLPPGAGLAGSGPLAATTLGIVPPDVPAPQKVAEPIPAERLATMPPPIKVAHDRVFPETPAETPAPAPVDPVPPKRGRGRPPKAASAPADSGVIITATDLYVDCVVEGVESRSLDAYVQELCDELVAKHPGVQDIRSATGEHPLSFGKWKGVLAAFVRVRPPEPGAYYVHVEGSEVRQVVVEALKPSCRVYVRGVRS